ncbi:hypothetical protein RR48_09434 [Papilio machaon]|uniref:Kazal-like domain-containing protein n=1 Tax=Papilio machaon TaxID=76193 RepID=A0A194RDZ8_PAPMA|nr:hypothetical protein RR48_09434 [Papilio machaon]
MACSIDSYLEYFAAYKKVWHFLRTYILTLQRFTLFLQGALLIVVLLETNVYLLLRRNAGTGFLRSINEDWVKLGSAGAEFLLGAALGWWGRSWKNLALSGCLGITAASGLIVLAFPYEESQPLAVELCGGGTISAYTSTTGEDAYISARTTFLVLTAILCALTKISVWAHGLTYLDDHEPQNGPYFYAGYGRARLKQTGGTHISPSACLLSCSYDTEFVQARYHIESLRNDPRTSRAINDIFRSLVIIFFVTVFRFRFSSRRSDGVKATTASRVGGVVAVFVSAFLCVVAAMSCGIEGGDIAGIKDVYTQPECSAHCGCNTANYGFSPVCAVDTHTTYFSPCDAGCEQYEDLNGFVLFENCTCGLERAIRGSCSVASCQSTYSFYLLFFALTLAAAGE